MSFKEEFEKAQAEAREEQLDRMPVGYHFHTLLMLCCLMIERDELKPDEHIVKAWLSLLRRIRNALKREDDDFMNKNLINRVAGALLKLGKEELS